MPCQFQNSTMPRFYTSMRSQQSVHCNVNLSSVHSQVTHDSSTTKTQARFFVLGAIVIDSIG